MDLRELRDKFKKENPFDEIWEGGKGLNKWNYSPEYVDWLEKQLLIHGVVVPKSTFYCRNKDATFDKVCNDQCKLCKHVEYMSQ